MNFLFNGTVKDKQLFERFLISIKSFPFKKTFFYINSESFEEVEKIIYNTFNEHKVDVRNQINKTQKEWQLMVDQFDSDFIWVCSQYDSLFVDSDINHLKEVLDFRREAGVDKLASINISNWVKNLLNCVIIDHGIWDGEKHPAPTQAWITNDQCDSYQIATKELYKSWFFDQDYGNVSITSLEELNKVANFIRPWKIQIPSRELLRKYDKITDDNNFYDLSLDKQSKKRKLIQYYLKQIPSHVRCLANPKYERGIFDRILRYYGFKQRR